MATISFLHHILKRYIVEPNKTLDDVWDALKDNLGRYDLWVLGSNGYHRHFKGDTQCIVDSGVKPEIRVCYDIAMGHVYVELMNENTKDAILMVKPCAYRQDAPLQLTVKAGQVVKQHWALADVGHWYDFEITSRTISIITDVLLVESKRVKIPLVTLQWGKLK
ncbi:phospholipase domain-containing protein [Acinetobacter pittii]